MILINTSPLLNTEIDNSHLELKNLMKNLKEKLNNVPADEENDQVEGTEVNFVLSDAHHFLFILSQMIVP